MIRYEFEYFSFLFTAVLFSAGNVKKNVFTVFTIPIVTIDGLFSPVPARSVFLFRFHSNPVSYQNLSSFYLSADCCIRIGYFCSSRFFVGFTLNDKANKKLTKIS